MLRRVQERTGKIIDDLIPPELSPAIGYLWEQYIQLRNSCDIDKRISYADVFAYQQVTGFELTPFESKLLLELDRIRSKHG